MLVVVVLKHAGHVQLVADASGGHFDALQPLRPVLPTHRGTDEHMQLASLNLAFAFVWRGSVTRIEIVGAAARNLVLQAYVQVEFRAYGHVLWRVRHCLVCSGVGGIVLVPCCPRLYGRAEFVSVWRGFDFDRELDGAGAGVDGRTVGSRLQQAIAGVHLRLHTVDGFGREFRLIAGSLVYPTHLVGVERDLIRRIRQFETEADTGTLVIVHGRIRGDGVIVVVDYIIERADYIIARVLIVATLIVIVEWCGSSDSVG